ncbi:MAG: prolipoprotein diacylglyceryl transferase [Pseudomonadales bacterium]
MLSYPAIDPVAVSLGPLEIHWYGLMYLFGLAGGWWLALRRARQPYTCVKPAQVEDLVFFAACGIVLGGRAGYVLFYNFDRFLDDPLWLLRVWEGGMSFHGGLLGVILAIVLFARKYSLHPIDVLDFIAPLFPLGLGLGRLGNFIGQELWGRETSSAWGMVFPADPLQLVRHPSQLYQAALEGVLLFVILYYVSSKPRPRYFVSGMFLLCYGVFRFAVEFVREPDGHIGFDAFGWMTRGQFLSVPMLALGIILLVVASRRGQVK